VLEASENTAPADLWDEFPELAPRVKEALRSYARNSQLALRADWRIWRHWCFTQAPVRSLLPATVADVVAFAHSRSPASEADERGVLIPLHASPGAPVKAASTLRRYVHTLSTVHRLARLTDPTKDADVAAVRRRLTRGRGAQRQKSGLNRPLLEAMLALLGESLWDARARALLLTGYCTLARSAELVSLKVEDLRASDQGDGYAVIRASKSDQEGLGSHRYLARPAIAALRTWLSSANITEGFVFRRIHKFGGVTLKALDPHEVGRMIRTVISRLPQERRPVGSFAGHSTRIGAAQDLVASGQDLLAVMQAGGWRDPKMPARYTEHLAAMRGGMARLWGSTDADEAIEASRLMPLIVAQ
jgi:integrase